MLLKKVKQKLPLLNFIHFIEAVFINLRWKMKRKIYQILSVSSKKGDLSWWVDLFLIVLISLNVIAIVVESVKPLRENYKVAFENFELFSVIVFTIEYLLRIWTANENPKFSKPVTGNIRYGLTAVAMVDLLAILPFWLPLVGLDLRFLRIVRIFRIFRLFKIARYVRALTLINQVVKEKREELMISIVFTLFMLLITSTLMYYVENNAQPDNFSSIPQTMWWSIATLTTVGYGDVYPITGLGKLLGGLIAILGVGLFALPTGILASGFSEQLSKSKNVENACPHCGKALMNE